MPPYPDDDHTDDYRRGLDCFLKIKTPGDFEIRKEDDTLCVTYLDDGGRWDWHVPLGFKDSMADLLKQRPPKGVKVEDLTRVLAVHYLDRATQRLGIPAEIVERARANDQFGLTSWFMGTVSAMYLARKLVGADPKPAGEGDYRDTDFNAIFSDRSGLDPLGGAAVRQDAARPLRDGDPLRPGRVMSVGVLAYSFANAQNFDLMEPIRRRGKEASWFS